MENSCKNNNSELYFGAEAELARRCRQGGAIYEDLFGSLGVCANSQTPYTDATQVRRGFFCF